MVTITTLYITLSTIVITSSNSEPSYPTMVTIKMIKHKVIPHYDDHQNPSNTIRSHYANYHTYLNTIILLYRTPHYGEHQNPSNIKLSKTIYFGNRL